jgi:hypothetical protein
MGVLDTGGVSRSYVDGALVNTSGTTTFSGSLAASGGLNFGYDQNGPTPHITAAISNVAVYVAVLDAGDIATHHSIGATGQ